jgi:Mandelate racemase / muconate lactonizing enzyme, N-terminal domain
VEQGRRQRDQLGSDHRPLDTDEGISGIGQSYHLKNPSVVAEMVQGRLRPLVIGQDPFDVAGLWERMFSRVTQTGAAGMAGISGIDTACYAAVECPIVGDIESVKALRAAFGDELTITVDANTEYGSESSSRATSGRGIIADSLLDVAACPGCVAHPTTRTQDTTTARATAGWRIPG